MDITLSTSFSAIGDDKIDALMCSFKLDKPDSGQCFAQAHLCAKGIRVPMKRVNESLRCTDGLGQFLRTNVTVERRKFSVPHQTIFGSLMDI